MFSMINYIVGSGILVMPVLAIDAGYVVIPIVVFFFGMMTGYTAVIWAMHQNSSKSIREMLDRHFANPKPLFIFYNIAVSFSLSACVVIYFSLLNRQISSLFPFLDHF